MYGRGNKYLGDSNLWTHLINDSMGPDIGSSASARHWRFENSELDIVGLSGDAYEIKLEDKYWDLLGGKVQIRLEMEFGIVTMKIVRLCLHQSKQMSEEKWIWTNIIFSCTFKSNVIYTWNDTTTGRCDIKIQQWPHHAVLREESAERPPWMRKTKLKIIKNRFNKTNKIGSCKKNVEAASHFQLSRR